MCKSVCLKSSHLLQLFFPSLTLFLLYSLLHTALVLQHLLSSCCRSVSVHMFQCLSSAFILALLYPAISVFSSTYTTYCHILLTYTLLHCVFTYTWVTCSSTLSGHPSSSFGSWLSTHKRITKVCNLWKVDRLGRKWGSSNLFEYGGWRRTHESGVLNFLGEHLVTAVYQHLWAGAQVRLFNLWELIRIV